MFSGPTKATLKVLSKCVLEYNTHLHKIYMRHRYKVQNKYKLCVHSEIICLNNIRKKIKVYFFQNIDRADQCF